MNKIKHIIVRSVLVVLLVAVGGGNLYAQKSQLSGTVSDAENIPLVGASIIVEGTHVGTTTDADGAFRLPAAPGQRLTVSYLGYKSKTVTVGSRTSLDIILESDNSLINEVVVVGYDTQKKVNLTGSVASVSAEDLANRPIVSSSTALQGIAPGVTVTTQSGAPGGDGGMIRVRGIGTFGGSSAAPLVLIDGVEGSLDAVDATQIDQISVLKDAASSAIYGSRAANGVILVTTKRGKKGQTSVTYRGYVGWQSPTDTPETVSAEEYMILSRETSFNDGKESIYTDDYIARYRENNRIDPDNYPLTDWQDQILTGSGFTHNHNLSLTASTERVRVMTSFGYLDQKGIIKRTDYQRAQQHEHRLLGQALDALRRFVRQRRPPPHPAAEYAVQLHEHARPADPVALVDGLLGRSVGRQHQRPADARRRGRQREEQHDPPERSRDAHLQARQVADARRHGRPALRDDQQPYLRQEDEILLRCFRHGVEQLQRRVQLPRRVG